MELVKAHRGPSQEQESSQHALRPRDAAAVSNSNPSACNELTDAVSLQEGVPLFEAVSAACTSRVGASAHHVTSLILPTRARPARRRGYLKQIRVVDFLERILQLEQRGRFDV